MIIELPDHYAPNVGGALAARAAEVIEATRIVPAYLHQFADLWEKGLRYGSDDTTFWEAVLEHKQHVDKILEREGLL
jgi:hypothetical protein